MRTKTEFIGFHGRRTQTGRPLRPGSGGAGRPWFAYENRIHWLSEETYANREAPDAKFRTARPPKFALENRIHWLSREASANRRSRTAGFRRVRPLKFALGNRIHWLSREASANRGSRPAERIQEACQPDLQKPKNFESADRSVRRFKVFFITYYILFIRKKLTVSPPRRSGGWFDPLRPHHCFPLRSSPPPSPRPRRCQRPHPCRHSESWEYHFLHRRSS